MASEALDDAERAPEFGPEVLEDGLGLGGVGAKCAVFDGPEGFVEDQVEVDLGGLTGRVRAVFVPVAEPLMFDDVAQSGLEGGEAGLKFSAPYGAEFLRWTAGWIGGPSFTGGGGDAGNSLPVLQGEAHDCGGEVRLVVGMGPDPKDRA